MYFTFTGIINISNTCISGNVAANAGCSFEIGEDGDYKKCQPMTLMFLVGNVNPKFKDGLKMDEQMKTVYEKDGVMLEPEIKKIG